MPFNTLNHDHLGEIRPRFRLHSSLNYKEVLQLFESQLQQDESVSGNLVMGHARLSIPMAERHYWSPELDAAIEPMENKDGTLIRCLIGPRQSVWLMFLFFYAAIGLATLFMLMAGFSNWVMDKPTTILWFAPIGLVILPSIYLVAKVRQQKGRNQMLHLVSFVYHTLDNQSEVRRIE